jgi:hypothetical protein
MRALSAELRPHPATPCDAVRRFAVAIEPALLPRELDIQFRIQGDLGRLRLPERRIPRRRDGLWQHSCFEAFLQPDGSESYHEFNFAPSGDWSAWRFGGRRSRQSTPEMPAPRIAFHRHADACALIATLPISALPELAGAAGLRAGIAAVVEAADGTLSYWALAHGGEKPDFHDPSSFALRVGRP